MQFEFNLINMNVYNNYNFVAYFNLIVSYKFQLVDLKSNKICLILYF